MKHILIAFFAWSFISSASALTTKEVICEEITETTRTVSDKKVSGTITITSSSLVVYPKDAGYDIVQYAEVILDDKVCRFDLVSSPELVVSIRDESLKEKFLKASDNLIVRIKSLLGNENEKGN